ncbi:hypothetical protein [Kitasatospora sp. NPDC004289]
MADPVIKWPDNAVEEKDDLAAPLADLLSSLQLLSKLKEGEKESRFSTPESLQVVRAGALDLTKLWASLMAGGGAGSVLAAWKFFEASTEPLKVAAIAAVGFCLAAVALAIAIMVKADVDGRASATAAKVGSSALVAAEFLRTAADLQKPKSAAAEAAVPDASSQLLLALAAYPRTLRVATAGGELQTAVGLRRENGTLRVLVDGGSIAVDDIARYTTEGSVD